MALISVSRGTNMGGNKLSRKLADDLGYTYVTREELADEARRWGVPVDKLQDAVHQPPIKFHELRQERLAYLNCIRVILCDRVLSESIVYDGHAGHMLLSGIPNVLRVRVIADLDFRVHAVMQDMGMSFAEARKYVAYIDLDRDRWSRFLYNVDWRDLFYYDMLVNLSQTGINHASEILADMARLPEFQLAEDALTVLKNLRLASCAHFKLLTDPRTKAASLKVSAHQGVVTVIGKPADADLMPLIPEVLSGCEGVVEIRETIADSTILLLQDKYDRSAAGLRQVAGLARKIDAAVHLMRLAHPDATAGADFFDASSTHVEEAGVELTEASYPDPEHVIDEGPGDDLADCAVPFEERGCAAGVSTFYGSADWLLSHLQTQHEYSMVILGDLFLHRPPAGRVRLREHLRLLMAERLEIPVATTDELEQQLQVRTRDIVRLAGLLVLSVLVVAGVLWRQEYLVSLLSVHVQLATRLLSVAVVIGVTGGFAYLLGSAVRMILRMIRFE